MTAADHAKIVREGLDYLWGDEAKENAAYAALDDLQAQAQTNETNTVVQFLYILLRDHLPASTVEQIVLEHCEPAATLEVTYSNKFLEGYAREIADRLAGGVT